MSFPLEVSFGSTAPDPPLPGDFTEDQRWQETARRRRLLDGTWAEDHRRRRREHLGTERDDAVGPTALVLNPLQNISSELARLYDEPPVVGQANLAAEDAATLQAAYEAAGVREAAGDTAALRRAIVHTELLERGSLRLEGFARLLERSNLWAQMPRFQEYTIACREYGLRPDVVDGELTFREVYPDRVLARPNPARPSEPIVLWELRLRHLAQGAAWTWDVYDLTVPDQPRYAVHLAPTGGTLGADVTAEVFGGQNYLGDKYPFRWASGLPFIPVEIYHAQRLGDRLWDPYRWIELTEGTLDISVLYAFIVHVFRDASWPQRYTVNCVVAGTEINETEGAERAEIATDPAMVLNLRSLPDEQGGVGQPIVGQWQPGGDVAALDAVLGGMVQRTAQNVGVSLSDVQRVSDASRSGVAISLTNEGKRAAQRRFRPHFRPSDEGLVAKAAALLNRATGSRLPETGWEVRYREIPLSPEEVKAKRDDVFARLDRGLLSEVDAYCEIYGGSPAAAELALARIRAERMQRGLTAAAVNNLNRIP